MADMSGKVCVVTGANSGIGKATAMGLAQRGAHVVMVCRNPEKGATALADVQADPGAGSAELVIGDLGSLDETRALAAALLDACPTLDVLVNNAGVWLSSREETPDGFEKTFAVNHLATFLLSNLLLDRLAEGAGGRVVTLSSDLHYRGHIDFDDLQRRSRRFAGMSAYSDSKLANVLFAFELARRAARRGVTSNAVHPGVVRSNLGTTSGGLKGRLWGAAVKAVGPLLLSPEKGAMTSIYCASAPELAARTGEYFAKSRAKTPAREARDADVAKRLWAASEALTGLA